MSFWNFIAIFSFFELFLSKERNYFKIKTINALLSPPFFQFLINKNNIVNIFYFINYTTNICQLFSLYNSEKWDF